MTMHTSAACRTRAALTWKPAKRLMRCACSSSWPMLAHTSVTMQCAPLTASAGSSVTSAPAASTSGCSGSKPEGQATRSSKSIRRAALSQELHMLLPSPTQATRLPARLPRCSRKVCMSARSWQGWKRSVSALMTGTAEHPAKRSSFSCSKVRTVMTSTMLEMTRAVSSTGSPRPSWVSRGDRNMALPPRCAIAASKETRVRVDDFSKTMASTLPGRVWCGVPACRRRLSSSARSSSATSSSRVRSSSVRKCLGCKWVTLRAVPPVRRSRPPS